AHHCQALRRNMLLLRCRPYRGVCNATNVARCCTIMQQQKPLRTRPLRYCCTPLHACATLEKAGTTSRATQPRHVATLLQHSATRATERNTQVGRPAQKARCYPPGMIGMQSRGFRGALLMVVDPSYWVSNSTSSTVQT